MWIFRRFQGRKPPHLVQTLRRVRTGTAEFRAGRRVPDRFDKFTERARRVLTFAQEEAQRFNPNYIGTEHLLLGLVREGDGVAAKVLSNLGVDLSKVRVAVELIIGRGEKQINGEIGLTPPAKKVIELAVEEARRLNHSYIGTEHLLLGLIREGEGIAFGVLESLGVSLERVRTETTRILSQIGMATLSPGTWVEDREIVANARSRVQAARTTLLGFEGTPLEKDLVRQLAVADLEFLIQMLAEQRPGNEAGRIADSLPRLESTALSLVSHGHESESVVLSNAIVAVRRALGS